MSVSELEQQADIACSLCAQWGCRVHREGPSVLGKVPYNLSGGRLLPRPTSGLAVSSGGREMGLCRVTLVWPLTRPCPC